MLQKKKKGGGEGIKERTSAREVSKKGPLTYVSESQEQAENPEKDRAAI